MEPEYHIAHIGYWWMVYSDTGAGRRYWFESFEKVSCEKWIEEKANEPKVCPTCGQLVKEDK